VRGVLRARFLATKLINSLKDMSKIYKVTISAPDAAHFEMVVEFSDDLASRYTESDLENEAKVVSEEAILKRWQKINPGVTEQRLEFVESFSVELLPNVDVNSATASAYGPYHAQLGVDVWMIVGPFSYTGGAPPNLQRGGAW